MGRERQGGREDGPAGGAPARGGWVLAAVGLGTFMSALDGSIVNTLLPVLKVALRSDEAAIQWVVLIYLLVVSGLLLSVGRWGDMRGHRSLYLGGFAVFLLASVFCGMAPSVGGLVAARGLQAFGAAMLFANSPALLVRNFPAARRGRVLGLAATMTYLGLTVGPFLGGWLATHAGWRWVFYINLPVGLTALWLSARFIPPDEPVETREPFDLVGAAVFMVGLTALLLALNRAHAWGWGSAPVLGLLALAAAALAGFVAHERRVKHPMLDLGLFRIRLFATTTLSALLNYISVTSIVFLLPFYLIQGRGLTPAQAGLALTAQPLTMALSTPLSGTLSDRIGTRLPAVVGMAVLAVGLFMLSRLGPSAPMGQVVAALVTAGLGTGVFISPNNSALMGAAPKNRQGIASGVLSTARNVGMALGVGLSGAILTGMLGHDRAGVADGWLFAGVRAGFLAACLVAALGAVTSAVREA